MIDLHCHLLPGVDDGAPDAETALAMARLAADDGISTIACTPHIYPGLYHNTAPTIRAAVNDLRSLLQEAGIALQVTYGADIHVTPDLVAGLRGGRIPTLHGSRYLLLEPPHHVVPPHLEDLVFTVLAAGYVPVMTHPERLSWISEHLDIIYRLVEGGMWMQLTAGSLTGRFGSAARYWSERFLDEGVVHILATDAHGVSRRPPLLAEGREAAEQWVGKDESNHLVRTRPQGILGNERPEKLPPIAPLKPFAKALRRRVGVLARLFGRG